MLCYVGIMSVIIFDWCLGIFVVFFGYSDLIIVFNFFFFNQYQQQIQFSIKMFRWFCFGIFKYYVLFYDVVEGEDVKYDIVQYYNFIFRFVYRWVFLIFYFVLCFLVNMWYLCNCLIVFNIMYFIIYFYVVMNLIKCVVVKYEL